MVVVVSDEAAAARASSKFTRTIMEETQKTNQQNHDHDHGGRVAEAVIPWTLPLPGPASSWVACLFLIALFVRFIFIWENCMLSKGATSWTVVRASLVLGIEIGLLVMAVMIIVLIPLMIVTWTTALVLDYILGMWAVGGGKIAKDGKKLARELSWRTLTTVVAEGKVVAAATLAVCFAILVVLRDRMLQP